MEWVLLDLVFFSQVHDTSYNNLDYTNRARIKRILRIIKYSTYP